MIGGDVTWTIATIADNRYALVSLRDPGRRLVASAPGAVPRRVETCSSLDIVAAAFMAVGAVGQQVKILAAGAGATVNVRVAPGIVGYLFDVGALPAFH